MKSILFTVLAVVVGEALLVGLITIVQEVIFDGVSLTGSTTTVLITGGTGTFLSACIAGFAAGWIVRFRHAYPQAIISLLIIAETTWLLNYRPGPDPLWFELLAALSLIVGVWFGFLVKRL